MGAGSPLGKKPATELSYGALGATLPWPEAGPFAGNELEQRYHKASQMAGVASRHDARWSATDGNLLLEHSQ